MTSSIQGIKEKDEKKKEGIDIKEDTQAEQMFLMRFKNIVLQN